MKVEFNADILEEVFADKMTKKLMNFGLKIHINYINKKK